MARRKREVRVQFYGLAVMSDRDVVRPLRLVFEDTDR